MIEKAQIKIALCDVRLADELQSAKSDSMLEQVLLFGESELEQMMSSKPESFENYTSKAVMQAQGSQLTNKYAEGYPGKRYYGGCQYYDDVENIARDRAKQLFGCGYANVQPHSGASANIAAFMAMCDPGDRILPCLGIHVRAGDPDQAARQRVAVGE